MTSGIKVLHSKAKPEAPPPPPHVVLAQRIGTAATALSREPASQLGGEGTLDALLRIQAALDAASVTPSLVSTAPARAARRGGRYSLGKAPSL